MGTQNHLWHFILSVLLCTLMALEGRGTTTATAESHLNVSRSTNSSSRTGPAANSSTGSVAEPDTPTAHSLLGTTSLSPSSMRMMGAEGRRNTTSMQEGGSLGTSAKSSAASSAFPTAGTGTSTAPSTGTETGTASSPPLSSATRSHSSSSSSSSSSSPEGSSAVPPSPQQNSTSSTTGMPLATTSQPSTALAFSSAGVTDVGSHNVTAEQVTPSPAPSTASTSPVPSTSGTSSMGSSAVPPSQQQNSTSSTTGMPFPTTSQPATVLEFSSPSSAAGTKGNESEPTVSSPAPSTASTSPVPSTSGTSSKGSSAVPPSPQQNSSSSTTGMPLATTSQPSTALAFSSAGVTDVGSQNVTAEQVTPSPAPSTASTSPVPSTSGTSSKGSSAVPPSPQQNSSSSTGMPLATLATTSHPATALGFSSPSSAGTKGNESEPTVSSPAPSTASTSPVPSTSGTSSMGSSAVPLSPQQNSTSSTTGMPLATTSQPATVLEFSSPSSAAGTKGNESEPTVSSPAPSTASTSPVPSTSGTSSKGSSAVPPSPQQNSSSSTTGIPLATTSQPSTALAFSSAGVTDVGSHNVTAEQVTPSPAPSTASTSPVAAASMPSPASETSAASRSSTAGSSTGPAAPQLTSTALPQGQGTATSPPSGSPSPSTATASAGSRATTPAGEGEGSTMSQGDRTTEPTANTSHSLPATSLATPSTTNLRISTSVNPSFTRTCSAITLSIQLQRVTSSTIQFSWEPQGGTADSPYTVRLLGAPGEAQQRVLNETSTAFENLLSAQQYQISVDVSTCSKNVSTSLTVQTAAEVYSGTTRITSENFKDEYQNKSSTVFKEFEKKFIMEITKHLPQKIQELKNGTKIRIVINSIEAGSVIVNFKIVLDVGQNITKSEISDAFTEALNRSTVFGVDLKNTFIEARNSCKPGLNDCDPNAACTAEGATYSCQCNKGFTDKSPQVPGRVCHQDQPSQQTSPVPPETNTTGFTGTTSNSVFTTTNSVFTTTFASAPCMTVSIKVQKVTGEEIELSWSSSSNSSLYNISVKDGKEIQTTTTNKTKAVFKNLLPGHVYNISVALSSCAENNPASVSVRTDSDSCFKRTEFCLVQSTGCSDLKDMVCSNNQAFACRVWLENLIFNNTLYNSDSEGYMEMSESFKREVVEAMNAELGNNHSDIFVLGFRPGSVITDFLFLLPKEEAMDVDNIQNHLNKVLRSKFGNKSEVQTLPVQSSTDNSSSWRVAVIVLGVLLGVALVLILLAVLFYIYVRRRSGMEFSPLYTW